MYDSLYSVYIIRLQIYTQGILVLLFAIVLM